MCYDLVKPFAKKKVTVTWKHHCYSFHKASWVLLKHSVMYAYIICTYITSVYISDYNLRHILFYELHLIQVTVLALLQYILHYISFVSEQSLLHLRSQDSKSMDQILKVLRQLSARNIDSGQKWWLIVGFICLAHSHAKIKPNPSDIMEISSPRKVKSSSGVNKLMCVK